MERILNVARFNLIAVFKTQTIIFFAIVLLNILISLLVTRLAETTDTPAGSIDPVALIWIFILGVTLFPASFSFMLSQGISRRTFFFGASISIAIMAAIWALLVTVIVVITRMFTNIWVVYELLYRSRAAAGMATWEFAALFLLAVIGWFSYLLFYVSGVKTRLALAGAPFVAGPLLVLFNILTDGAVFESIGRFLAGALGLASDVPNPYAGAASMLLLAIILSGANFLLSRKVQVRE